MNKVTKEIIEELYKRTTYSRNGLDLDVIFEKGSQSKPFQAEGYQPTTVWGDRYNLVYYLLEQIQRVYPELGLGTVFLHSDGGMQDYFIVYRKQGYVIIISQETYHSRITEFTSVENFVQFLNHHAETINNFGK